MRLLPVLVLSSLAIILGGLAKVQFSEGGLSRFLGSPPKKQGERLHSFNPAKTQSIRISFPSGKDLVLFRENGLWKTSSPWEDRADPRMAGALLAYSRQLTVEEAIPKTEIRNPAVLGLGEDATRVTLRNASGAIQASYLIGRTGAWELLEKRDKPRPGQQPKRIPTTYILPDGGKHLYLCAGTPRNLLPQDGLRLRDHRPLLISGKLRAPGVIHPERISAIRILYRNNPVLLARKKPGLPWHIAKPIELRADHQAISALLLRLRRLTATLILSPGEASHPPLDQAKSCTISLHSFPDAAGKAPQPVVLTIHPPADQKSTELLAEVSDRPGLLFSLPAKDLKPLPLTIARLRDTTLTGLNHKDIREVHITCPRHPPVRLVLIRNNETKSYRWMTHAPCPAPKEHSKKPRNAACLASAKKTGSLRLANEFSVARLFASITKEKALHIATDNASNLAPYGLSTPEKRIRIRTAGSKTFQVLDLGRNAKNEYYAHLRGSFSVLRISPSAFRGVATAPQQWKDTLVWSLPVIDLTNLVIQRKGHPHLVLGYDYLTQTWTAHSEGKNLTPSLNQNRANKFLDFLESIRVKQWLGSSYPLASHALQEPSWQLAARFKPSETHPGGLTLTLQVATGPHTPKGLAFYAKTNASPYYALLSLPAAQRLATDLFEQ